MRQSRAWLLVLSMFVSACSGGTTVLTEEGEVPFLELGLKADNPGQFLSDPDDRLAEHIVLVDCSSPNHPEYSFGPCVALD